TEGLVDLSGARPSPQSVVPPLAVERVPDARELDDQIGLQVGQAILDRDALVGRRPGGRSEGEDLVTVTGSGVTAVEQALQVSADGTLGVRRAGTGRHRRAGGGDAGHPPPPWHRRPPTRPG